MYYNKKATFVIALILAFLAELFVFFPAYYIAILIAAFIVAFVSTWFVLIDSIFSKKFLYYLCSPLLFIFSVFAFLILNEVTAFQHIGVLVMSFLSYLYFESVYLFNFNYTHYHENSIENVSGYMNLVTFFFMSLILFAGVSLIGLPFWALAITVTIITAILLLQSVWVAGLYDSSKLIYCLALVLIMVELYWAISYLPTNFYSHGFFLTISYYCLWGLTKSEIHGILNRGLIIRYLFVTLVTSLMVILTTRWI